MSYQIAGASQTIGKKDIESAARFAPASDKDRLIFPLNISAKQFMATSFSAEWAEGRITLDEVREVLYSLQATKGFNSFGPSPYTSCVYFIAGFFWLVVSYFYMNFFETGVTYLVPVALLVLTIAFCVWLAIYSAKMTKEIGERELNLNIHLLKTDARFGPRGLKFRAGSLGAWISLHKMPVVIPEGASGGQEYEAEVDTQAIGVGGFDAVV